LNDIVAFTVVCLNVADFIRRSRFRRDCFLPLAMWHGAPI